MSLNVYNSLTNTVEKFVPKNGNKVNMYVCGPTVYNSIHIGNARPVVFFDMFKRYLVYLGYDVKYATNITDVDDKIIKKAIELKISEKDLTTITSSNFLKNVEELNCLKFDYTPYATNYIDDMIKFIEVMVKKDLAYTVDGDVYFRVNKSQGYGKLSNQKTEELTSNVRIENSINKESPIDFTLWKKTDEGLNWKTKFSNGRPGWHTECVCMINSLYKDGLDIHGGGFDLKFPHHENEIAQYECVYEQELSKYFMHVGRLDFNGEKMSKSIGNVILVDDLRKDDSFMPYKLLVLMHHYRSQINFSNELFDNYKKDYEKILRTYKQGRILIDLNSNTSIKNEIYIDDFNKYMSDDFNTPNVYTLILKINKELNVSIRNKDYTLTSELINTIKFIFDILGIILPYTQMTKEDISLYKKWEEARINKNYEDADLYRSKLVERNIL